MNRILNWPAGLVAVIALTISVNALWGSDPERPSTARQVPTTTTAPTTTTSAPVLLTFSKTPHSSVEPVARPQEWWQQQHESFNRRAKEGDIDVIFLGDSITQSWEKEGREVWEKFYGGRKAVNFGINGDCTQHVLWRLDHGNIEGLDKPSAPGRAVPRVVVLLIGTNNSNANSPAEIADGIIAVVAKLRHKLPRAKVLLLGIFPRGEQSNPLREKAVEANRLVSRMAAGRMIHYLDLGAKFLQPDGRISPEIMPDYLHLSPKGYQIWAEAIEPKLRELLGEQTTTTTSAPAGK